MITTILSTLFVLWLLVMLYVGPTYYRRLGALVNRLERDHCFEYQQLGRPSQKSSKMMEGSEWEVALFVLRKDYLQLSDAEATRLGNAVRTRLIFIFSGPLLLIVMLLVGEAPR